MIMIIIIKQYSKI